MKHRTSPLILLTALGLLQGCYAWVDNEPRDMARSYQRAMAAITRIEKIPYARRCNPRSVKLWLYDRDDDRIVKASLPLWAARMIVRRASGDGEGDELDRFGLRIEDLLDRREGLVLQARMEDQQVLIWLE